MVEASYLAVPPTASRKDHEHRLSEPPENQVLKVLDELFDEELPQDEIRTEGGVNDSNGSNDALDVANIATIHTQTIVTERVAAAASPSSSVQSNNHDFSDDEDDCYIETSSPGAKPCTDNPPSNSQPVKSVTNTPETSMMQDSSDDEEADEEEENKMDSPLISTSDEVEDYDNTLEIPELCHTSDQPSLLLQAKTTFSTGQVCAKSWITSMNSEFSEVVPAVGREEKDGDDAETYDGIEESVVESEVQVEDGATTNLTIEMVVSTVSRRSSDSASVSSDCAVVPCYDLPANVKFGCSVRKTKSKRTLEKLIAGAGEDPVMITGDTSGEDEDDDNNSTGPPAIEVAFEDLWSEEGSQMASVMMKDTEISNRIRRIRDALSVDSDDDGFGVYEDTASSTKSDSADNSQTNEGPRSNTILLAAAKLFSGISTASSQENGATTRKKRRSNRDEESTSSSTKDKVVAAVSALQKQVSKKLVGVGETVTPVMSSLQKSVSKRMTVVSGSVTKGILSRNKSSASATETSAATPTTTNPESITEYPDLEALEDHIIEVDEEDDVEGDSTVISLDPKDEATPRTFLWWLILILIAVIVIIFVAMLSVFALQS